MSLRVVVDNTKPQTEDEKPRRRGRRKVKEPEPQAVPPETAYDEELARQQRRKFKAALSREFPKAVPDEQTCRAVLRELRRAHKPDTQQFDFVTSVFRYFLRRRQLSEKQWRCIRDMIIKVRLREYDQRCAEWARGGS